MALFYRLGQFWRMLWAGPLPLTLQTEISAVLSQQELELFYQFSLNDQWHSYRVMETLRSAGHSHPDLLSAALLHDIGKTRATLSGWDRTLIVIVEALFPRQAANWGKEPGYGWRSPFVVRAQHAEWGAIMAQESGCRPLTVSLIRRHQDKLATVRHTLTEELLRVLQWADDLN